MTIKVASKVSRPVIWELEKTANSWIRSSEGSSFTQNIRFLRKVAEGHLPKRFLKNLT